MQADVITKVMSGFTFGFTQSSRGLAAVRTMRFRTAALLIRIRLTPDFQVKRDCFIAGLCRISGAGARILFPSRVPEKHQENRHD
jgi:hypothetical protein